MPRFYSARWILPVAAPPIGPGGGWVAIDPDAGTIVDFGAGPSPEPQSTRVLGDAVILPGLINAHTHLEFSDLEQPIGSPGNSLADWIGQVVASRAERSPVQTLRAMLRGIAQSKAAGVTHVVDIATPPTAIVGDDSMGVTSLFEVLGLSMPRYTDRMMAALNAVDADPSSGFSPHAPYSLRADSIQSVIDAAAAKGRLLAMHVAESPEERELLFGGGGPFREALEKLGMELEGLFPWANGSDRDYTSLIERLSAAPSGLLVHGNDLQDHEIDRIAAWPHLAVVYCPRTHHFFGHRPHPIDRLWKAGVPVAIGTDSRASNPDLKLWSELRHVWNHRTDLEPLRVLAAATRDAADAIGQPHLGRIEAGASGRLLWCRSNATTRAGLYEDLAACDQPVFLPT